MAIGEALGGIVGGVLGNNAAKQDRGNQKKMMKAAIANYEKIGYPPDYAKALVLKEFESAGLMTPELEQDLNSAWVESEVGKISEDPATREAQMQALTAMQQRGKLGLTPEDRARLNQIRQQVQIDSQAKQGQILQEMQSRGQAGGGAEMAARLSAAQAGADRASSQSDQIGAQASQNALAALGQTANMAGNIRTQDFNNANTKATALDERNRFLADNSISRQTRNTRSLNDAKAANLKNNQEISNKNAEVFNTEKQRQATSQQQQYADKLRYAEGISGQQHKAAEYYGNTAAAKAQAQVNMGKGVGSLGDSAASAYMGMGGVDAAGGTTQFSKDYLSDENLKNDIDYTDDDVQKWLDNLSTRILRKKM